MRKHGASRDLVRQLHADGVLRPEIVKRLGLSRQRVAKICDALDLPRLPSAAAKRRARVAELHAEGHDPGAIALLIPAPRHLVAFDLRQIGVEDRAKVRVRERRTKVIALAGQGLSKDEIARRLEVSIDAVRWDLREREHAVPRGEVRRQRLPTVRQMADEGLSVSEIASAVGVSGQTIRVDLAKLGITTWTRFGRMEQGNG